MNYQATRDFFVRLIVQHDSFDDDVSIEPLLTYRVDPFTLIYAGATTRWTDYSWYDQGPGARAYGFEESERQYFVKMQVQLRN